MTRKDYQLLAGAVAVAMQRCEVSAFRDDTLRVFVDELSRRLAADNPRFDACKFREACGV